MDPIIQWFLGLFTQMEWRAFIWLILGTMAGTHTVKIAWRWSPIKGCSGPQVALVAATLSMVLAYFIWPAGSGPWWLAGLICGPASNVAFKAGFALLKRYAPDMAQVVNLDRRKTKNGLPPEGTPERRKS